MHGIRAMSLASVRSFRDLAEIIGAKATVAACERELVRREERIAA